MSKITLVWIVSICTPLALPQQQPTATQPVAPSVTSSVRVDSVHRVDPSTMYFRIYAVVPMVGSGTAADPRRPMFGPLAADFKSDHSGVLGFQMQLSDDKTRALVEIVAANRNVLLSAVTSTATGVVIFEQGKASKALIEAEFQKYKKGFTLNSWIPVRPQ
jgi:hypothetical protein